MPPRGLARACLPGWRGPAVNQLEKVGGAVTPRAECRAIGDKGDSPALPPAAALEVAGRARPVRGP